MTERALPPIAPGTRVAWYTIDRVLRRHAEGGSARASDPVGHPVFLRWTRRTAELDEVLANEYSCLACVGDIGQPDAIDLLWFSDAAACVTEWIEPAADRTEAPPTAEMVAQTLLRTLARCRAAGWVHGDIKPSNIVMGLGRVVRIVDWELAAREGARTRPGTLGWAPPHAWDDGYVARSTHDFYSAALTALYFETLSDPFTGSPSEILRAQRNASLSRRGATPCVRLLCAIAAGDADPRDAAHTVFALPRVGAVRKATGLTLRQLHSDSAQRQPLWLRVDDARERARSSAISDSTLAAWAIARSRPRARACPNSPLEELRDRFRVEHLQLRADALQSGVRVFVTPDPAERVSQHDAALPLRSADPAREPELPAALTLDEPLSLATDAAHRSLIIASGVAVALGVEHAPLSLVRALSATPTTSADDLLLRISELLANHALRRSGAHWIYDDSSTTAVTMPPLSLARRDCATADLTPTQCVDAAETLTIAGRLLQAYVHCVRAVTALALLRPLEPEPLLRAVDVWMDMGASHPALATLSHFDTQLPPDESIIRRIRISLSTAPSADTARLADRLDAVATTSASRLTVSRARCVLALSRGDLPLARTHARACRSLSRGAHQRARLELGLTLVNYARRTDRLHSAARLARVVAARAERAGAIRLALQMELNRWLLPATGSLSTRARGLEGVAESALSVALKPEAGLAFGLSIRFWLADGAVERARTLMGRWSTLDATFGPPTGSLAHTRTLLDSALNDYDSRFADILALGRTHLDSPEIIARVALLEHELGAPVSTAVRRALRHSRAAECRATRAVLRLSRRTTVPARVTRVVSRAVCTAYIDGTGLMLHALRVLLRSSSNVSSVAFDTVLAQDATGVDAPSEDTAALAALALCGSSSARLGAALSRLSVDGPGMQRTRPLGVRAWEWEGARLIALAARSSTDAPLSNAVAAYLSAAAAHVAATPDAIRSSYSDTRCIGTPADAVIAAARAATLWRNSVTSVESRCLQYIGAPHTVDAGRSQDFRRLLGRVLLLRPSLGVDDVLTQTVRGVQDVCRAERAVVVFDGGDAGVRARVCTSGLVETVDQDKAEICRGVLARIRQTSGALVIDDVAAEDGLIERPSVRRFRPRSLMACSLRTTARYLGYLYVENRSRVGCFDDFDVEVMSGFASQAALALENATLVDDLRTTNRELCEARTDASRAEKLRSLGRLVADVAHDLNNILTVIVGEIQLLRSDPDLRACATNFLMIERAAQDGAACIRRIQDGTRVGPTSEPSVLQLSHVLEDVVAYCRARLRSESKADVRNVRLELTGDSHALVRGVASELRELFTNLVSNAVDSLDQAGGLIEVNVRTEGRRAIICIRDNGRGIPPEVVSRVFEPFFSTKGSAGNGLGLSIAREIARRHGGDITIESLVGRGTSLEVALPRAPQLEWLDGAPTSGPVGGDADRTRARRYLIVDDDRAVRELLAAVVRGCGADVEVLATGAAAVAHIERVDGPIDGVISDVYLPGASGLDVALATRCRFPDARVALMSGGLVGESDARLVAGESAVVIRKPLALADIERFVRDAPR